MSDDEPLSVYAERVANDLLNISQAFHEDYANPPDPTGLTLMGVGAITIDEAIADAEGLIRALLNARALTDDEVAAMATAMHDVDCGCGDYGDPWRDEDDRYIRAALAGSEALDARINPERVPRDVENRPASQRAIPR